MSATDPEPRGLPAAGDEIAAAAASRPTSDRVLQWVLIGLLVTGCWLVLKPFFTAIMFCAVVGISTWPAYEWLLRRLGGRIELASVLASVAVLLLAVTPLVLLFSSLVDGLRIAADLLEPWLTDVPATPPAWLDSIPLVGSGLSHWWHDATARGTSAGEILRDLAGPARSIALAGGRQAGNALMQVGLIVILLYFVYRHGPVFAGQIVRAAERTGGEFAREMLATARRSIVGVMFGVVGAGLAQAMVASLGFWIAGLPNPFLLGALTFALSLVPLGPPILWGGAAVWLFHGGEPGRALFMLLYGFFGISSVDNLVKPLIISHANRMAFALTLMGVIGGLIAFGVMGVFLGPALLALAISLTRHWLDYGAAAGR
ncbi:AI-2E family transporter [Fontimonas sp. SYSU GA230001]|uniref:AI-2E family transporter n=1 Tax=Fontimonas sp. SYSU GA230001 TaxID=3142450 RepID=UPI0032B48AC9